MALSTREAQIKRIRDEYTEARGRAHAESENRKYKLYAEIPELRDIDAKLAATAGLVMRAVIGEKKGADAIAAIRAQNGALREKRRRLLEANGYPGDYTDVKYACEECKDTGFVGIDMCLCFKRKLAVAMLESSGLGQLYRTQTFDSFSLDYYSGKAREDMERTVNKLKDFARSFTTRSDTSWLLCGGTGLGKTHLSTAVAVEVIERGYEVCYESMQTVVDDFADCQFRGEGRESVRKYYDCDLLVLDDVGTELVNQFTVSCLYNIINHRVNNRRPIIISTNLSGEEIRRKYDDRVTSRLFGYFNILRFDGVDVRRQKLGGKK